MTKNKKKFKLGIETLILISIFALGTPIVQGAREPDPFFTITIMLPTNNLERLQYSEAIAEELAKIGIDVDLEMKTWAEIIPRVFYDEAPPHDEGGFDICFYAMEVGSVTSHPGSLMRYQYQDIPPDGANVMHWSPDREDQMNYLAAASNDLIDSINSNINLTEAKEDFYEWQKIWYEAQPNNMIYSQSEVSVISNGLFGFDPLMDPLSSVELFWTNSSFQGNNQTIVLAASQISDNFNAIFTGGSLTDIDHYNAYPPLDSLIGFTPSREIILPSDVDRVNWIEENFNTSEFLDLYPRVASDLGQYSIDGLQYNISVREDVLWHDGHRLDAWDVAFSFQTLYIFGGFIDDWIESIGNSPVPENNEGIYSFIVEDKNNDSFFEHISFEFVTPYAPFETDILGTPLLPEHILGDPSYHGYIDGNLSANFNISQWNVQPNQWASHSFNTGNPAHPGGLNGPIGCGSVVFKGYNSLTREITLQKFENIQWNHSTSSWVTNNSNDHYLVNDGKLLTMPTTIKTIVETNEDDAIDSMKTGQVNILDPLFTDVFFSDTADLRSLVDELLQESAIRPIISGGSIYQALYFNPKFEQGGINHLNLKGVRHAVSHMIPRLEIIDQLLNGLGTPSFSPLLSTSWATIPENELIAYKQTVKASDGSKPEENATTAYDQYSIKTALAWLKTEGYDTSRWEVYHGFKPPKPATSYDLFIVSVALITTSLIVRKKRSI
ncbi:MAG: ABC transporter substrate-binding protein [Candidatus Hodarchaeales archaeon]|jgi:ABC-type transport system substrate-binding protein